MKIKKNGEKLNYKQTNYGALTFEGNKHVILTPSND